MSQEFAVRLQNLSMQFGGESVLRDLDLSLGANQFHVVLGPSGSGKSTILFLIAGLLRPTGGLIETVCAKSDVAFVPQFGGCYPQLSVLKNLQFALKHSGMRKADRDQHIRDVTRDCHLDNLLSRRCATLSGGEMQRVGLARGLLRRSPILLLDEPLSHVDVGLRRELRCLIREHQQRHAMTVVYVTHDPIEAVSLGDTLTVLANGVVEQSGALSDVVKTPATLNVLRLTTAGPCNVLKASTHDCTRIGLDRFRIVQDTASQNSDPWGSPTASYHIAFRATDVRVLLKDSAESQKNVPSDESSLILRVRVVRKIDLGNTTWVEGKWVGITSGIGDWEVDQNLVAMVPGQPTIPMEDVVDFCVPKNLLRVYPSL